MLRKLTKLTLSCTFGLFLLACSPVGEANAVFDEIPPLPSPSDFPSVTDYDFTMVQTANDGIKIYLFEADCINARVNRSFQSGEKFYLEGICANTDGTSQIPTVNSIRLKWNTTTDVWETDTNGGQFYTVIRTGSLTDNVLTTVPLRTRNGMSTVNMTGIYPPLTSVGAGNMILDSNYVHSASNEDLIPPYITFPHTYEAYANEQVYFCSYRSVGMGTSPNIVIAYSDVRLELQRFGSGPVYGKKLVQTTGADHPITYVATSPDIKPYRYSEVTDYPRIDELRTAELLYCNHNVDEWHEDVLVGDAYNTTSPFVSYIDPTNTVNYLGSVENEYDEQDCSSLSGLDQISCTFMNFIGQSIGKVVTSISNLFIPTIDPTEYIASIQSILADKNYNFDLATILDISIVPTAPPPVTVDFYGDDTLVIDVSVIEDYYPDFRVYPSVLLSFLLLFYNLRKVTELFY